MFQVNVACSTDDEQFKNGCLHKVNGYNSSYVPGGSSVDLEHTDETFLDLRFDHRLTKFRVNELFLLLN